MVVLVVRIAGRCKMKKKNAETLKRLKLYRKYSARLVDEKDKVMIGMVEAVKDQVAYAIIDAKLEKKISDKLNGKDTVGLHPPVGGFKKTTKERYPKGIKGNNPDLDKFVERML